MPAHNQIGFQRATLLEADAPCEPISLSRARYTAAAEAELPEPNAVTLDG